MSSNFGPHYEGKSTGGQAELEQLLLSYYPRLNAHIAERVPAHLRGVVSAEDVLQQAYVQAFRSIGRFQPNSESSTYAWLKTIAVRKLMDACRRRQLENLTGKASHLQTASSSDSSMRSLIGELMGDQAAPDQNAMAEELLSAFQVAMAAMPDDYRQAIQLRYLEAKPLAEVAERLNRSEDAVRGVCHRARDRLREELMRLSRYI